MPFESRFASDANREALGTLRWILSRAEEGFFIFTADSPELQRAVARELQAENSENTAVFDYAATAERAYSYRTLARWAKDHPEQGTYIVVNLQLALGEERDIYNLNLSRDMLSGHKKIWLFGMTRETDDRLTRSAVDFYSFVRVRESFAEAKPEPRTPVIEPALSYSGFTSAKQAREFIRAYSGMENEYTKLDVSVNTAREALLSAAITLTHLAEAYRFIADYDKAMSLYLKVLEINEKVFGKDHPATAASYNNIATVYFDQGDYAEALEWHEKALSIFEKILGEEHPATASSYNNIAMIYHSQGDYPKAFEWFEKVLALREKILGVEHPDTAGSYNNIASVYCAQKNYAKALEWHKKALAIHEKVLGLNHPNTIISYDNIAMIYHEQGDYRKALEYYEKALTIREKILDEDHPSIVISYNNIALVYDRQGDYPEALKWYKKALRIREKVLGKEHPDTARNYNNIAGVYHDQGDYAKALEWYEKSYRITLATLGAEHPTTVQIKKNMQAARDSAGVDMPSL